VRKLLPITAWEALYDRLSLYSDTIGRKIAPPIMLSTSNNGTDDNNNKKYRPSILIIGGAGSTSHTACKKPCKPLPSSPSWALIASSPSSDDKEKRFREDVNTPTNKITATSFVDSQGNSKAIHISDYSNSDSHEYELLADIIKELLKYDCSLGWYSTGVAICHEDTQEYLDGVDSDLAVLHSRCLANGVDSIIDFNNAGIPYIRSQTHIDLHSVFGKPMVQTTIFKNAYRTLKLDDVSKAVLEDSIEGVGGKYKGLTGKQIQTLPIDEQKKYALRDAQLVMQQLLERGQELKSLDYLLDFNTQYRSVMNIKKSSSNNTPLYQVKRKFLKFRLQ
jgi:hypothetical protein